MTTIINLTSLSFKTKGKKEVKFSREIAFKKQVREYLKVKLSKGRGE